MTIRGRQVEFGVRVVGGLALALFALAVFSWLAFEVREGETLRFDGLVRNAVHQHASPALTVVMKGFTVIGASVCVFILLSTAVVSFWAAGLARQSWMMMIAVAGSLVLEFGLKHVFHRARPEPYFNVPLPKSYSFPSGHALAAACLYGMLGFAGYGAGTAAQQAHRHLGGVCSHDRDDRVVEGVLRRSLSKRRDRRIHDSVRLVSDAERGDRKVQSIQRG